MMVLDDSSLVEKKFLGRPRGERSIRTPGTGSGSAFVCTLKKMKSRQAIATLAVTTGFRRDPVIGFFRSTFTCRVVTPHESQNVVNCRNQAIALIDRGSSLLRNFPAHLLVQITEALNAYPTIAIFNIAFR
jgi:hypothetical protein